MKKGYEIVAWFYDKLNAEYNCDQIHSWLALRSIEKETEKAFLMDFLKVHYTDNDVSETQVKIWVPKSCVNFAGRAYPGINRIVLESN
ncbi:MAG: hypothetical protein IJI57_04350 [Flexilinea sp.]|nr:hypothetical protein [Flexilinea sp.]